MNLRKLTAADYGDLSALSRIDIIAY